jgi:hypothetical protein
MGGYVSTCNQGTTELRIHGVSGTPATDMLDHPNVKQVAGDRIAGFYRRWWPVRPEPPQDYDGDSDDERQEAYSWGGLTAASKFRALWLLLLPFLLANVAFFMVPYAPTDPPGARTRRLRKASEALQRVFALGLTCMLVLTSVSVAMDLVAWQCTRPGTNCTRNITWLGFLTKDWFAQPSRRLAVAALVPLATILLLWWLSRTTWSNYEARRPPPSESAPAGDPETPLERRRLWNGRGPVRRLRAVHVSAGLALVGVLLVAPIATGGTGTGLLQPLLAALLVLLAAALLLAALPVTATRHEPKDEPPAGRPADGDRDAPRARYQDHDPEQTMPSLERVYRRLPWLTLVLVAAAGALALLPDVGRDTAGPVDGSRVLPWFSALSMAVMVLIAVAWALVAVLTAALAWATRTRPAHDRARAQPGARHRQQEDLQVRRAWFGLGTPVALMLAWLVGGCFSAGLSLLVAGWLGDPVPAGGTTEATVPLSLPPFYFWAAVAGTGVLVLLVAGVAVGARSLVKGSRRLSREEVPKAYPRHFPDGKAQEAVRSRARTIARAWAIAGGAEIGRTVLGLVIILVSVGLYAGLGLYLIPSRRALFDQVPGWLLAVSVTLITTAMLALVGLGRAAYTDRNKRRTLGILWDVGTFWPRATHPLAPPSYGERVMPDLITRVEHLTPIPTDEVVLSGHSQGAVIAAALVLQLDATQREQTCLLTYGCPLRRLYSLFFPGYFGLDTLQYLGRQLGGRQLGGRQLVGLGPAERARWAWRNLYRPSDYIGGPVFRAYPAVEFQIGDNPQDGDNSDIDRQLIDPVFMPLDGDLAWPATRGHSNYFADEAFPTSRKKVLELHRDRWAAHRAAYEQAIASGHPEQMPRAAVNLGMLLQGRGDVAGARAAYQLAVDSGHPEQASAAQQALRQLGQQ